MKKLITTLAVAIATIATAHAAETTVVDYDQTTATTTFDLIWKYETESKNGVTYAVITGARSSGSDYISGDVSVPTSVSESFGGPGYIVKKIASGAFANQIGITAISVPITCEWIGDSAFSNCTSLASVSLPYGLRSIGKHPFVNTAIPELILPDTLIDMDGNIAAGAIYDINLVISDSSHFAYSDDGVLYNKDFTKLYSCPTRAEGTITIPASVTNICADAFFGCFRLTYLNLPKAVNTIGSGAFNVSGIWPGLSAPESTPKLQSVFYNGDVPNAQNDIYDGAPAELVSYVFTDGWGDTWKGRPVVLIDDVKPPILSIKDDDGITWYYRIVNGTVEIYNEDGNGNAIAAISPKSTSGVRYYEDKDAVDYRMALKVPNSINGYAVTRIGNHALDGCKALTYIGIPASVEEIGDSAFRDCTAVRAIDFFNTVPFNATDGQIVLPGGITKLGYHPFEGMKASYVSIPYTVTEMDGNPLSGMDFVREVVVDTANTRFYSSGNVIYDKRRTKVIGVPANYDGSSLSFPDTVKEVGPEALQGCDNLDTLSLPAALESISANSFKGCSSLASLTIPATVATIGSAAFAGCDSLVSVVYDGNAPTAPDDLYAETPEALTSFAMDDATGFTKTTWKDRPITFRPIHPTEPDQLRYTDSAGVTWKYRIVEDGIAEIMSVESESAITSLTLPTTIGNLVIKGIGDSALANLRGITAINLPQTYEWIGDGAFSNCTSLAAANLGSGLRTIGRHPFEGTATETIGLPDTVSAIDGNIFFGCDPSVSIAVGANNPYFAVSPEGALYDKDFATLFAVPMTAEELAVPATVAAISDEAFAGCIRLKKITFEGNAPAAADGIFADTPELLKITVLTGSTGWDGNPESDTPPTSGLWRDRQIFADDSRSINQEYDDGTVKWTYDIAKGKAVITGASGEAEVVTVPATLGGYAVSTINADALDGLSGVKAYKSESDLYKTKNGCLYSADGKTLIRVPDSLVLPYSVTTEVSSKIVTVTIVPGLKDSGNPGNDGTSVTTNITSISTSRTKEKIDGDISFDALLSGVTTIADHAFYGCNSNLTNDYTSTSENLSGETGFIGTSGDAYVRTSTKVTSTNSTYETTFTLPATVKTVGANAFEGSGVVSSRNTTPQTPTDNSSRRQELTDTRQLAESSRYIGWIEQSGKIVGTVAVKTGKARNGVIKTSGSVVKIGAKKTKIKSMSELSAIDGLTLVKDLSASKSDATAFNAFKGKCWTVALMTSNSNAALLDGYTTLSIAIQAKGKVRIAGTAADGTKISASAQMVVDGDTFKIPVAAQLYSGKRGGFATVFTVTEEGEISVDGTSVAFTAILNGAPVHISLLTIDSALRGNALSGDISIWGAGNDEYSLAENLGWKPRYTKSSGQFKGKLYLIRNSDMKRVRATVTGVVANEIGYGTAVVKGVRSLKVEVK